MTAGQCTLGDRVRAGVGGEVTDRDGRLPALLDDRVRYGTGSAGVPAVDDDLGALGGQQAGGGLAEPGGGAGDQGAVAGELQIHGVLLGGNCCLHL